MRLKMILASASLLLPLAFSLPAMPLPRNNAHDADEAVPVRPPKSGDQSGQDVRSVRDPGPIVPVRLSIPPIDRDPDHAAVSGGPCGWERELRLDPTAGQLHLGVETYPQTLQLADHEVVLTFDDGPSPDTTPRVLQALKDACVHATFFLIGRNAAAHPQLARREFEDGHSVGHHSNTHPSFTLRGFDVASGEKDIAAGIAADEKAVYGDAARPADAPHVPFFRFPGFADSPTLLNFLDSRHIAVFGTDLWAADWLLMTPDQERRRVLALLDKQPLHNGIILFHDTKRSTAKMLPALLRDLKRARYKIVHLVYAPGAPHPALTAPRTGPSETEKIIARLRSPIVPGSHRL